MDVHRAALKHVCLCAHCNEYTVIGRDCISPLQIWLKMSSNVYFVFCESLESGCWAVQLNMSVSVSVPLFLCLSHFGSHRTGNVAQFNTRAFCSISKLLGFVCVCVVAVFLVCFSDEGFVSKSSTFYRTNDFCHGHKGSIASERL